MHCDKLLYSVNYLMYTSHIYKLYNTGTAQHSTCNNKVVYIHNSTIAVSK